jgi:hypothetical protein
MQRRFSTVLAAVASGIAALACSDGSGPNGDNPRVTVQLTDAAGDVKAAVVTISEIHLQGPSGKLVLRSDPVTTNLVALANATATLVSDAEVAAGTYSELRFVISGGYVEVDDGAGGSQIFASSSTYAGLPAGVQVTGELQMPSLAQSGLKVQFDGSQELAITADQDLLVDFDVSQSFGKQAGNSGKWVMHPVIKGASASAAATVVATLRLGSGVTLPSIGGTVVTLASFSAKLGGETQAFADADGDGVFEARFRYLLPGSYSLMVNGPVGLTFSTSPVIPAQVDAAAAAQATVGFTVVTAALP